MSLGDHVAERYDEDRMGRRLGIWTQDVAYVADEPTLTNSRRAVDNEQEARVIRHPPVGRLYLGFAANKFSWFV